MTMSSYTGQVPSRALSQDDFNTAMTYLLTYLKNFPSEANALTSQLMALLNAQVYNAGTTYNPSGYTVPDCVYGSDGVTYVCIGTDVIGDNPVGSSSGDWVSLLLRYSDVLQTVPTGAVLTGGIIGGGVSQNSVDPDKDLDIDAFSCWSDDADPVNRVEIILPDTTIQLDVALGSGNGGLSSSLTAAANTGYYIFALSNASGSSQAVGLDTSSAAVNLLADHTTYTKKRLLCWWRTNASANWCDGTYSTDFTFTYTLASEAVVSSNFNISASPVAVDFSSFIPDLARVSAVQIGASGVSATQGISISTDGINNEALLVALSTTTGDTQAAAWYSTPAVAITPRSTDIYFSTGGLVDSSNVNIKIHKFKLVR